MDVLILLMPLWITLIRHAPAAFHSGQENSELPFFLWNIFEGAGNSGSPPLTSTTVCLVMKSCFLAKDVQLNLERNPSWYTNSQAQGDRQQRT
jgi:hypothetical protein